jgi:integrase
MQAFEAPLFLLALPSITKNWSSPTPIKPIFRPFHFHSVTKTLQNYNQTARIQVFAVPNFSLCPLLAFKSLQQQFPVFSTDPLLSYRVGSNLYYFSQGDLKKALKLKLLRLGLSHKLTFHLFHHSGASLAFASRVPLQAIQAHVTWASEALWAYIDASARDASVPTLFAKVFSSLH